MPSNRPGHDQEGRGNTRLARANTNSPYYAGLADVLTRAFGVPAVLAEVLRHVDGIDEA